MLRSSHREPSRLAACLMLLLGVLITGTVSAEDDPPSTFGDALRQGTARVDLRYRFEGVSDDAPVFAGRDAEASTLRTALSYRSKPFRGFSFMIEAEDVTVIGNERYNNVGGGSLANGITNRPVVADPEGTEINQAFISYSGGDTTVHAGRRGYVLGNQRFVGTVAWRQNHQTFDGISIINQSVENLKLQYHYIDTVNRIFGDDRDMSSHLLHADIKLGGHGTLSLYGYSLDFDAAAALSTNTFGIRLAGKRTNNRLHFGYALEFANQTDNGDNPLNLDANYYLLEAATGSKAFGVKVGLEVLEGEPGRGAFTTPLATLHKFNGFADKFLRTPATGLEDLYFGINGGIGRFKWAAVYHEFTANSGNADYGSEIDLLATYKTTYGQTFGFKAARYEAEDFAFDTDKVMLWTAIGWGTN